MRRRRAYFNARFIELFTPPGQPPLASRKVYRPRYLTRASIYIHLINTWRLLADEEASAPAGQLTTYYTFFLSDGHFRSRCLDYRSYNTSVAYYNRDAFIASDWFPVIVVISRTRDKSAPRYAVAESSPATPAAMQCRLDAVAPVGMRLHEARRSRPGKCERDEEVSPFCFMRPARPHAPRTQRAIIFYASSARPFAADARR